jgi:uncharacterized protein YkwD
VSTTPHRLGVECLEGRDCPAVTFFNGILTVTGTSGADTFVVTRSGNTITAEGQRFNVAGIGRIVITGLGGNDVIRNLTAVPSVIYGGTGNDTIVGGVATDILYGGHGNDTLNGRGGIDRVLGGAGTDTLVDAIGGDSLVQGSPAPTRTNSLIEQQIINIVNQERTSRGLPPLTVNLQLNAAAYMHTADMVAISNRYGHGTGHQHILYGTVRPQVTDRLDAAGYDNWTTSFTYGENIANGFSTAAAVMTAWMNSTGHRESILHTTFTEIGVSVRADSTGRLFFTQNFGHRA